MQPPGGNSAFNDFADSAKSREVAERIKPPAPADAGANETQLLPIPELVFLETNDAASFGARETLQAGGQPLVVGRHMSPESNS